MLAPKPRTNLPLESNFWIALQPFEEQRSNTQMLLPSLWSTWTLMAAPSLRPSGSCSQLSCILYGLGAALGGLGIAAVAGDGPRADGDADHQCHSHNVFHRAPPLRN